MRENEEGESKIYCMHYVDIIMHRLVQQLYANNKKESWEAQKIGSFKI
jgi:hypothetical protein